MIDFEGYNMFEDLKREDPIDLPDIPWLEFINLRGEGFGSPRDEEMMQIEWDTQES